MQRLHTVAGVLGALMLLASGSSASDAPEHPGTISGAVVSLTTGEPVAGAYVGIGDFGDAGGANLERFRKQGLYAETETDQQGRFVLNGVAVPGEHPLVITHPEFIRHDQTVALGGKAEAEVEVRLKLAATIEATAVDADGNALGGRVLVRLEASDGRRFIPPGRHRHLSTFASSVWLAKAKAGAFSFTELDAGQYSLDALQLGESQMRYHGGLARVEVELGQTEQVQVEPADHQTKVTIKIAKSPSDLEIPPLAVVSRNPGLLLWYDGKTHSLEDPRLGRIVENALFYTPVESGGAYTVSNLPPGTYSIFGGAAMCLGGDELVLAHGDETTLEIPRVRPDGVGAVNLSRLRRRAKLEARAYTTRELCELLTAESDGRVRFSADPAIQAESVEFRAGEMQWWDVLERLFLQKGWRLQEKGTDAVVLVPESMFKMPEKAETGPPPVALLYHEDAQVRIQTVYELAMTGDRSLVDDLIRAQSLEFYTPVHNAYRLALRSMTGRQAPPKGSNWKAWLGGEVAAGRLAIDYLPLEPDALNPEDRERIQPLATRLGPEHFDEMAAAILAEQTEQINYEGLRYMAANDHLPQVQEFLKSDWVIRLMAHPSLNVNSVAYNVNLFANPGPLRDQINARVRACLDADNPTVVANALHLLAGQEGYSTVFTVPGVETRVPELVDSPVEAVAHQARRAMARINPLWNAGRVSYEEAFVDLYETLGREYPCFELKGIDWKAVGEELLPRVREVAADDEFGLVCLELVARLEDSHANLSKGTRELPQVPFGRWDPGFACLVDDRGEPAVYHVDSGGPAESAGVKVGMTVVSIDGTPAAEAIERSMRRISRYVGYSSDRYLRYDAARHFYRRMEEGGVATLEMHEPDGQARTFKLPATLGVRYLPRLPVPTAGISDSANVSWTMLDGDVGYIYVRRIRGDLIEKLDRAVGELNRAKGLIVDVRGNSGGGFDFARSHRNFDPDDLEEPDRPRFDGPMALVIDARCISAGEGWASWFIANKRARVFGEATAGASSRKRTHTLKNGFYAVKFPVKAYRGYLDRPIERRGLEPDVPLMPNAQDLAAGCDTVLEAARRYLLKAENAGS